MARPRPARGRWTAIRLAWLIAPLWAGAAPPSLAPPATNRAAPPLPHTQAAAFPGETDFLLAAPTGGWATLAWFEAALWLPSDAPTQAQALAFVQDWDGLWFQALAPQRLRPGETNRLRFALQGERSAWTALRHEATWTLRALADPERVGLRVFAKTAWTGGVELVALAGEPRADSGPPAIRALRFSADRVPCHERVELTFDLPDRYVNPFDPETVDVTALIERPDGAIEAVHGFYWHHYYRTDTPAGEERHPQGRPAWKVRYTPRVEGRHTVTLTVRDRWGETRLDAGQVTALRARRPGFIGVAAADPRRFGFADGGCFVPIGHNIRSPDDTRMDTRFPWTERWPQTSRVYERYFKAMRTQGANSVEIWLAAWSLGLEWTPEWRGYHGIGQYNLMHAWELDQVVEAAEQQGIAINLVIHNHGKFAARVDREWDHNPFNIACGGYLESPDEFFTDPRARRDFANLMRYTVARWGHSPAILAWQLWSELNLAGEQGNTQLNPDVVTWHRDAARDIRALDPYGHLIATHVSGDYRMQNPEIVALPEMDHAAVDAYHMDPDPLRIVDLMAETALYNNAFGKPVQVTEFGGSAMAADVPHLKATLHAGLWATVCTPVAGTPFFWWWQLIDEENYYPMYGALTRFLCDEDLCDPRLAMQRAALGDDPLATPRADARLALAGPADPPLRVQTLQSDRRALGWIWRTTAFERRRAPGQRGPIEGAGITLRGLTPGRYKLEFWDTTGGLCVASLPITCADGVAQAAVPPFDRDLAFKLKPDNTP